MNGKQILPQFKLTTNKNDYIYAQQQYALNSSYSYLTIEWSLTNNLYHRMIFIRQIK